MLLLLLSGGTSKGHLEEREAKVTPPQEVTLHFLEARCVAGEDTVDKMLALYYAESVNNCNVKTEGHTSVADPVILYN